MPKPACVPCGRFFRPRRNGQRVVESMPKGGGAPAGNSRPDLWQPYKVWMADLWECEGCGAQIISGWGSGPIAEQHRDDFERQLSVSFTITINDC